MSVLVLDDKDEPAKGFEVLNSLAELIGWLDPEATLGQRTPMMPMK